MRHKDAAAHLCRASLGLVQPHAVYALHDLCDLWGRHRYGEPESSAVHAERQGACQACSTPQASQSFPGCQAKSLAP